MNKYRQKDLEHPKFIHEVHDLWPKTLIDVGGMKKYNPFVWIMQRGENYAYKNADNVASTLEFAESYMQKHGLMKGKFVYISNGIAEEDWNSTENIPDKQKQILESIKKQNKFIVGYFGGFALSNALDRLIDAAKEVEIPNIQFVLIGKGVEKERLRERVKKEKIFNVTFLDPVPKKCIPKLVTFFNCTYIGIEKELEIYHYGISPTKMYDSMIAGIPIVMSVPKINTAVNTFRCGIQCDVNDEHGIKRSIEKLYQMSSEEREEMGKRGKEAAEKYYRYEYLAQKYEMLFPDNTETILFINHYAGSNSMGMDFRPFYLAREWERKGYKVKILAADYSHLRHKNPEVSHDLQWEVIEGIKYYWIKTSKYNGNGIKRALTMFQFAGKLFFYAKKIAKKIKPDVIITASTYPLDVYGAVKIKNTCSKLSL